MNKKLLFFLLAIVLITGTVMIKTAVADECEDLGEQCGPPPECPYDPAPLTPGYWKNHPESWVYCFQNNNTPLDEINICCENCYPCTCDECTIMAKAEVISIMKMPAAKDKTYTMFDTLVAAKLNRWAGADVSCINLQINQAAQWICDHPVGSGVTANSEAWQDKGEALQEALDNFNNYGCPSP